MAVSQRVWSQTIATYGQPMLTAIGLLALGGCGTDLGECDMTMLGGGVQNGVLVAHTGQAIVGTTCASGRCHSQSATGELRFGAPAGLDFDVLPGAATPEAIAVATRAGTNVVDWAEEMWELIDSGAMPPPPPSGAGELTGMDKEAVRNWLACGAEIVPAPPATTTEATWNAIWPALAPKCVTCHSPATAGAGGGFVLGDMTDICGSYLKVFGAATVTTMCTGRTVVVPNMPAESLLLDKLSNNPPACGSYMPLSDPMPLIATNPTLVDSIEQWIVDGALAPTGCP